MRKYLSITKDATNINHGALKLASRPIFLMYIVGNANLESSANLDVPMEPASHPLGAV